MPKGNPGVPKPRRNIPKLAKKFVEDLEERAYEREMAKFMNDFHKIYFKERKDANTEREQVP